jgi:hypothetical protein
MDMFEPDAPWEATASHVQVFLLYGSYLEHAPQDQVNTIVSDLNRHGIAIALEVGAMNVGPSKTNPPCGGLGVVEGYGTPAEAGSISRKIKIAGGVIKYISMDEPLFYGHYYNGQHACHSDIDEIVGLVVPTLNTYLQEFPNVTIGEVEPMQIVTHAHWQDDLFAWSKGFRTAMNRPLAFLNLDIPWASRPPSEEPSDALAFYRQAQEMQRQDLVEKIGIINDGTPADATDAAWVENAKNHVLLLEGRYGLRPDQDIFQSWMVHPTHALPDGPDRDTLTGLVRWYFRPDIEKLTGRGNSTTHQTPIGVNQVQPKPS